MALIEYLRELSDSKTEPSAVGLAQLSGLLGEDLETLTEQWPLIPGERRLELLTRLAEMADDNVELDFHAVFSNALTDELPRVREAAVNGLWESEDRKTIPRLIERLNHDGDDAVRAAAASVLGRFALLADAGKFVQRDADALYNALMGVLRDDDEPVMVRRRALEAAAPFRRPELHRWLQWGYDHPDPAMRQSAVFAMGRSGDSLWLSFICDEMESDDPAMRFDAANAAREMGEEEALPSLIDLANDIDAEVSLAALHAIGGIGGARAKKFLRGLAASEDDQVLGVAAAEILDEMESEDDFSMFQIEETGE